MYDPKDKIGMLIVCQSVTIFWKLVKSERNAIIYLIL